MSEQVTTAQLSHSCRLTFSAAIGDVKAPSDTTQQ